jgi:hypothetical protein
MPAAPLAHQGRSVRSGAGTDYQLPAAAVLALAGQLDLGADQRIEQVELDGGAHVDCSMSASAAASWLANSPRLRFSVSSASQPLGPRLIRWPTQVWLL